jgi:hypothetical protein
MTLPTFKSVLLNKKRDPKLSDEDRALPVKYE